MKWVKIFSIIVTSTFIGGGSFLFWVHKNSEKQQLAHKKEQNLKAYLEHANMQNYLQNYAEAESLYRNYLDQFPTDKDAMVKLAKLLSWEKKYDEAIHLYQQILTQDPQNIQVRRQYAKVLIWNNQYPAAAMELKKTLPSLTYAKMERVGFEPTVRD